ncbi:hypothetical protein HC928_02290 [bacterium]|nr:hypothetical protein [bacterium]
MLDEDSDVESPLEFVEMLGNYRITEEIRKAYILASIEKFSTENTDLRSLISPEHFSDKEKSLAKSVSFLGPYFDLEEAEELAQVRLGVVCTPNHLWDVELKPQHWVVSLAN